jgi:hypothetical protein
MNTIYEVGIRYDKATDEGVRKVTESYILDAASFTEAEKRITEEISPFIRGDFRVISEKITNVEEVITAPDSTAGTFYKIKHCFITLDEKSGKEKRRSQYIIIQADSADDANNRYKKHIEGWISDTVLVAVSETKYLDYFPKK